MPSWAGSMYGLEVNERQFNVRGVLVLERESSSSSSFALGSMA